MIFLNIQAVWASPVIVVSKQYRYHLVSCYRAVNKQIEKLPGVLADVEAEMGFATLHLFQDYCQYTLAK